MADSNPPILKCYPGIGNANELYLWGHTLSSLARPRERCTRNYFVNAWEMLKRYLVKPAPGLEVRCTIDDTEAGAISLKDGFFELHLASHQLDPGWHRVEVQTGAVTQHTKVYIAHGPDHFVVSDIDDTFLVSHSRNTLKKLWLLLTRNPTGRKPFKGVREFFDELREDDPEAPFIYVSSSEWNLFDFIQGFRDHYDFQPGVFMLQEIKMGLWDLLRSGTGDHHHKEEKIRFLFQLFPDTEFTLVGDSGQRDPAIYRALAIAYPKQVRKIYIRDLHKSKREALHALAEEMKQYEVELIPFTE